MRILRLLLAPILAAVMLGPSLAPAVVSAASLLPALAPSLGTASSFAVLAGTTVTNTGPTRVNADLGLSPSTAVTGFAPGVVAGGTIHAGDPIAALAQTDTTTAYTGLTTQLCPLGNDLTGQNLGGKTLTPGVYCFSSSAQLTGALTLDAQGDANAVFVFKIGSTLTTASASSVVLINGGSACNVFWQVGSSATLGTTTAFTGNIIAFTSITLTTGVVVSGRAFARNGAVTMDTNTVGVLGCAGGPAASAASAASSAIDSVTGLPTLGTAANLVVLGGSTVTNTGQTVVNANLGVSPGTAVTGFAPGKVVDGTIHAGDALAALAQVDTTVAYTSLAGKVCPGGNDLTGQDLGGKTLTPGVYCFSSSAQLTGALKLDAQGDANAIFVFKIGSTLTTASAASVVLINGGSLCNVFWQVGSSATIGTTTAFVGNIIALTSITLNTGAVISGRALARNGAVTMDTNTVGLVGCGVGGTSTPPAQITLNSSLKMHPQLQFGAQTDPTRVVRVIVLRNGPLSGGATEQFTIIPALVTSMQLGSIPALALDPNVRYISPDGPVQIIPTDPNAADGSASQPAVSGTLSGSTSRASVDSSHLTTTYPFVTGASNAWAGNADLGVSPGTAVTGFPAGKVTGGTIHSADALAGQAQADTTTAYNSLTTQNCPGGHDLSGQDLGGKTLTAGVYCFSSSAQLTGALTLDAQGNASAVFVFKMGSTLTSAASATVALINGGSPCNVFWQVGSSATLGATTRFVGNIIALSSITLNNGALVSGRALARNGAVTMDANSVSLAACAQTTSNAAPALGSASSFAVLAGSTVTNAGASTLSGGPADTGAGVTVAVLDTGVDIAHPDLTGHVIGVSVNQTAKGPADGFGHGTHVTGVIVGQDSGSQYVGIAPGANVVSVKVSDDTGETHESDVLRGLQWVGQQKTNYNIRAINLSISASVPQSYATSPIDAAVEYLWHQGLTVVATAGNLGAAEDAVWYAPGNDPRVITVGCLDDNQTVATGDDSLCEISSRGVTEDGFAKPELVAPGRKIVSTLASGINGQPAAMATTFPDRITADGRHIRLSGTSMSAPMVTGTVALLLARHPSLTPDQIKQLLVSTATDYPGQPDHAGALNIVAALQANIAPAAEQAPVAIGGSPAPAGKVTLLWDGSQWATSYWTGTRWDSIHWDSAHFDSAYWDSIHWDSIHWDSIHWDSIHWDSIHWDSIHWDSIHWDSIHWDSIHWDSIHWDSIHWDSTHWD
jgi:subtilisin family serine protease